MRLAASEPSIGVDGEASAATMAKTTHNAVVKPEERELEQKHEEQARLESDLADRELRAASLRAELSTFERQYLRDVGLRYAELDELKAQIAERLASEQPDNERAQQAAREARARADETRSAAGTEDADEPKPFEPTPELKRLYRDVAKRVHPDLTSDRADRAKRQELMAAANEAYENGDETRLARILEEYECSPESVQGEGPGAELVRVIRKISQARNRLSEIEAETEQIVRSDIYQLKSRLEEAKRHGRDLLKEMSEKVDEQIEALRRRLEEHSTVQER